MSASHGAERERASDASGADRSAEDGLVEELRAEFADHVASAREQLERDGIAAEDAQRRALEEFGDVAAVVRRCWWIRKGDEIMNRAISITLLVVLITGLATLGIAGWHTQRSMGGRMDRLSEQLATLAETQQSLLEQQAQTLPVRIRGRLYLGEPSRPAANAKLWVYQFTVGSDMNRVRFVQTDAQGNFNSGPLPPGAYFATAPLYDRDGDASEAGYGIQSRPLYLYEGNAEAQVEMNVLAASKIRLALAAPVPDQIEGDDQRMEMEVRLSIIRHGPGGLPWNPEVTAPTFRRWPLVGSISSGLGAQKPSNLPAELALPEGKYDVSVTLSGRCRWKQATRGLSFAVSGGAGFGLFGKLDNVEVDKDKEVQIRVGLPTGVVDELRAALESQRFREDIEKLSQQHELKLEMVAATPR